MLANGQECYRQASISADWLWHFLHTDVTLKEDDGKVSMNRRKGKVTKRLVGKVRMKMQG